LLLSARERSYLKKAAEWHRLLKISIAFRVPKKSIGAPEELIAELAERAGNPHVHDTISSPQG